MEKLLSEDKITPTDGSVNGDNGAKKAKKPTRSSIIERSVGEVLSGNIFNKSEVKRQYPYVFFVALLMLIYIANGYHVQKLHRRNDNLTKQVKELRAKALTVASIRMSATRQSVLIEELKARGIPLNESLIPPKVIAK